MSVRRWRDRPAAIVPATGGPVNARPRPCRIRYSGASRVAEGESLVTAVDATPQPPPTPPEPPAREVIDALFARLGETGVRDFVSAALKASDRASTVVWVNSTFRAVKLPADADRGRMSRLILQGLEHRSPGALDAIQGIARQPFERTATPEQGAELEKGIAAINAARGLEAGQSAAALRKAARAVADALLAVIDAETARRMVLFNAFPDTVDPLLEAIAAAAT